MSATMGRPIPACTALDQSVTRVERRLIVAISVLAAAIVMMIGATVGQPAFAYLTGTEATVTAVMDGAGCAAHLEWTIDSSSIQRGTTVHFANETVFWRIPVVIERIAPNGSSEVIATSPPLDDGDRWSYTFWRDGEYRVVSGQQVQQLAGLDTTIRIAK